MWDINEAYENLHKEKHKKEELSGFSVYSLWKDNEIVYIGKSQYLKARLTKHLKTKDFDKYSFIKCESEEEMTYIESVLIIRHAPKLNKSLGGGAFTSLSSLRKHIQKISEHHNTSKDYYINNIRKKLLANEVNLYKYNGSDYIKNTESDRALKFILN